MELGRVRIALLLGAVALGGGCGRLGFDAVEDAAAIDGPAIDAAPLCSADRWCRMSAAPVVRDLVGIAGSGASDVWAVGAQSELLHYDGATWTSIANGQTADFRGVWVGATGALWVAPASGNLLEWNGTTFDVRVSSTGGALDAVVGFANDAVAAVGGLGTGTRSAYFVSPGVSGAGGGGGAELYGVWGASETAVYAVGLGGALQKSVSGGMSYAVVTSPASRTLFGIRGVSGSDIWAVGAMGQVAHFDGAQWTGQLLPAVQTDLRAVWGAAVDDYWAVGQQGVILHFDGSTWSASSSGTTEDLLGVWGASANDLWVVGANGTLLRRQVP